MPALTSKHATVLVTGANGFIATWIVGYLLEQGYSVRAAVRIAKKGEHLLRTYASYGDKLKLVEVGDVSVDNAFDEAVKGVDGIIHTASPVGLYADEPSEMIDPAVKGVVGILQSAQKHAGHQLARIVITSSCAAISHFSTVPITLSEADWNDGPVKECEEKGRNADNLSKYAASKVLAAWEFVDKHKSEITWDIAVINPPWVFGPVKHDVASFETLPPSNQYFYNAVIKGDILGGFPAITTPGHGFVDVRDVAYAHIRALEAPAAGGERIICCAGSFVWQDIIDVANWLSPKPYHTIAKGEPGEKFRAITWNTEKQKRILGIKFRTLESIVRETLTQWAGRGY
ncbi:hypothetical protein Hypma_009300 [Hypsizygus marmoreus]|uniref:NAD-dependent epimerase/dehydratase domain-containing protein n=1 Tax=Hypsizygus marmoreus TaxID=39966 RepID=A0A369JMZ4_HYPMA|nr:hypothetical protein Hypma_009300 [Hypsizygus marmoreus]